MGKKGSKHKKSVSTTKLMSSALFLSENSAPHTKTENVAIDFSYVCWVWFWIFLRAICCAGTVWGVSERASESKTFADVCTSERAGEATVFFGVCVCVCIRIACRSWERHSLYKQYYIFLPNQRLDTKRLYARWKTELRFITYKQQRWCVCPFHNGALTRTHTCTGYTLSLSPPHVHACAGAFTKQNISILCRTHRLTHTRAYGTVVGERKNHTKFTKNEWFSARHIHIHRDTRTRKHSHRMCYMFRCEMGKKPQLKSRSVHTANIATEWTEKSG